MDKINNILKLLSVIFIGTIYLNGLNALQKMKVFGLVFKYVQYFHLYSYSHFGTNDFFFNSILFHLLLFFHLS